MPDPQRPGIKEFDLNYPNAEIVIGLVYAVGTESEPVLGFLQDQIRLSGYASQVIKLSEHFQETGDFLSVQLELPSDTPYKLMDGKIRAGNAIRSRTGRPDICALIASSKIYSSRDQPTEGFPAASNRSAHVIVSLKRPEEVDTLRRIYGAGFFLIGIFAGESDRRKYLVKRKGLEPAEADELISRDQREADKDGQRTRDTFQMADVFVSTDKAQYEQGLSRFLGLVYGEPFTTPTRDEHAMFLAYAASLRSGDLARQVGAALTCADGEVVALGCNDVPAPWGGLYWSGDGPGKDQRDHVKGYDSNDRAKQQIIDDVLVRVKDHLNPNMDKAAMEESIRAALKASDSRISQIAEFGRSVHAEMDALMAAGRTGISFRNSTLYTTTFPCHTCTRHIATAGLKRVVYIEPYPKSRAEELHADAICIRGEDDSVLGDRIPFEAFLGIGPRRFFDLFSLKLSSGHSIERKQGGEKIEWDLRRDSKPRVPMPPNSYLEREQIATSTLSSFKKDHATETPAGSPQPSEERPSLFGPTREDSASSRKLA